MNVMQLPQNAVLETSSFCGRPLSRQCNFLGHSIDATSSNRTLSSARRLSITCSREGPRIKGATAKLPRENPEMPPVKNPEYAPRQAINGRSKNRGVVITGGTKGIGFAMAREFLAAGDRVMICGRGEDRLTGAVAALQREFPKGAIYGRIADVSSADDVERLGEAAAQELDLIHIWVNNAGAVTSKRFLADLEASEVESVIGTNVIGSFLGCRQALRIMRSQPNSPAPLYHIFNMGFSSWGAGFSRSASTHKATKVALTQLSESLAEEVHAAGLTSIGVHNLSPGMVLTDLLLKDSSPGARKFFNTMAEEPETVAANLVPRMRAIQGNGTSIDYLTPLPALARVISGVPQILGGGRFFDNEGNRVVESGQEYERNGVRRQYDQVGASKAATDAADAWLGADKGNTVNPFKDSDDYDEGVEARA